MIREAEIKDANELAKLMKTLGYPSSAVQMKERLESILKHKDYQTYVYEAGKQLNGMIGMTFSNAYHTDDPHVRVIAFVVEETAQGKGIGKSLMREAEQWAEANKAKTIILNSGNREDRIAAHQIYESLGFVGKATGFYKKL